MSATKGSLLSEWSPVSPHFPVQHRVSLGLNHLASVIFSNPVLVSMNPNTQTLNRHDVEDFIW